MQLGAVGLGDVGLGPLGVLRGVGCKRGVGGEGEGQRGDRERAHGYEAPGKGHTHKTGYPVRFCQPPFEGCGVDYGWDAASARFVTALSNSMRMKRLNGPTNAQ